MPARKRRIELGNDRATSLPGASTTLDRESASAIWIEIEPPSLLNHHWSPRAQSRPSTRWRCRLSSMRRSPARPKVSSSLVSIAVTSPQYSTRSRRSLFIRLPADDRERPRAEVHRRPRFEELGAAGLEPRHLTARMGHDERAVGRSAVGDEDVPPLVAHLEVA